jgi:carbohydrate kinase (thermoresistant glucokinase family)
MPEPPLLVIMGVSGAGKSSVAALLAAELRLPFIDGDDLHPETNRALMAAGVPLSDGDRWPWLALVGDALAAASATGLVIACSALKRSYRDAIRDRAPAASFILLDGPRGLLAERMAARNGHFMPASLLDSQLATLEPLQPDEAGFTVGIAASPKMIVAEITGRLSD